MLKNILIDVLFIVSCISYGIYIGWYFTRRNWQKQLRHEASVSLAAQEDTERYYQSILTNARNEHRVEMREHTKRTNKLLDEVSQALGVDEVELPSFGRIYLNQTKEARALMQEFYEAIHDDNLEETTTNE